MIVWKQYRHFYKVNDITFTVWKQWGGDCYITPYPYIGITSPKKNYIKTTNSAEFFMYISPDSLFIFSYLTSKDKLDCNLPNYKYQEYPLKIGSGIKKFKTWGNIVDKYQNLKLPYIYIDVKENYARIRE